MWIKLILTITCCIDFLFSILQFSYPCFLIFIIFFALIYFSTFLRLVTWITGLDLYFLNKNLFLWTFLSSLFCIVLPLGYFDFIFLHLRYLLRFTDCVKLCCLIFKHGYISIWFSVTIFFLARQYGLCDVNCSNMLRFKIAYVLVILFICISLCIWQLSAT